VPHGRMLCRLCGAFGVLCLWPVPAPRRVHIVRSSYSPLAKKQRLCDMPKAMPDSVCDTFHGCPYSAHSGFCMGRIKGAEHLAGILPGFPDLPKLPRAASSFSQDAKCTLYVGSHTFGLASCLWTGLERCGRHVAISGSHSGGNVGCA
jgi:hypothetical protein